MWTGKEKKMNKKLIGKKHNHLWVARPALREILRGCRASESSRYAIGHINIDNKGITATDGRQLFNFETEYKIDEKGLHWLTKEGFLLPEPTAGNFPVWKNIIPPKTKLKRIQKAILLDYNANQLLVVSSIIKAGVFFNIKYLMKVLEPLGKLGAETGVFICRKGARKHPVVLKGTIQGQPFTYALMPLNEPKD